MDVLDCCVEVLVGGVGGTERRHLPQCNEVEEHLARQFPDLLVADMLDGFRRLGHPAAAGAIPGRRLSIVVGVDGLADMLPQVPGHALALAAQVVVGIDIILARFERYKSSLWGHVVELPDSTGRGRRLVDRTNNVLEAFFHMMKHAQRRRSGRKILTQDFERLPAAAGLAHNLPRADYVELVCGSLDKLPQAFASIDIVRATKLHASTTQEKAATGETTQTATASKPRGDRPLIRAKEMRAFLEAAARRPRAGPQARSA